MFTELTYDELSELDLKLLMALGRVGNEYGTDSQLYMELDKISDEVYGLCKAVQFDLINR